MKDISNSKQSVPENVMCGKKINLCMCKHQGNISASMTPSVLYIIKRRKLRFSVGISANFYQEFVYLSII